MNAKFPVYHDPCGWSALLPPRQPLASLRGHVRTRFAVIGAGYTGLAAARRLGELFPRDTVALLEAGYVGEGSAGRNSGFLIDLPHNTRMSGHFSPVEVARRQIRLFQAGRDWLASLVEAHGIDCGWNPVGKYHGAATARGEASLRQLAEQIREWGETCQEFDRDALAGKLGTSYYHYGFYSSHSVFVQPAALVRGLADSLPEAVTLYEGTPVLSLSRGRTHVLATPHGQVEADVVICANNAFLKHLGWLRDRLITIFTYAAMTPALPGGVLAQLGDAPEWGLIPANRLGTTLRKTLGGRFLIRSMYSYEREMSHARVHALLTRAYRNRYPDLPSHAFEHVWGGTTCLTGNGAPYFGALAPGVYAAVGCNGAGVVKGTIFGKLLAEMVGGGSDELLSIAQAFPRPNWLPPEPLREIGARAVIGMHVAQAGRER